MSLPLVLIFFIFGLHCWKIWKCISFLDNTAVILTNRIGFSRKEEPVFSMIIFIADNGIPSLTSTNTLTIQVCDCGESGSTETCTSKGLRFIMGFKTELIIAILICIMVIFGKLFWIAQIFICKIKLKIFEGVGYKIFSVHVYFLQTYWSLKPSLLGF